MKVNNITRGEAVLCIDVLETSNGFMALVDDEYIEDSNGDNCWRTFPEAMTVLKQKLEVIE
jgi:hypothetical protein